MIKYIWIVMMAFLFIGWAIYTIADTINVIKMFRPGYRFEHLEDMSQGFYVAIPTVIFFYSFFSFLLS